MKRTLVLVGCLAGALFLTYCGGGSDTTADAGGTGSGSDAATVKPDASQAGADASSIPDDAGTTIPDDAGTTIPADAGMAACDPVQDMGCMTGHKCTFIPTSATAGKVDCATYPAGTKGDYEACTADSDCKSGFLCVPKSMTEAFCQAFCKTANDCPQAGGKEDCNLLLPSTNQTVCSRITSCDVIKQDCTTTGEHCYLTNSGGACFPQNGMAKTGDKCTFQNDCPGGDACIGPQGSGKCQTLCDPANPACPNNGMCQKLSGSMLGACQ